MDEVVAQGPAELSGTLALGAMVFLSMRSPLHRRWPLAEAGRLFLPPIRCGQYRLFLARDRLVGFTTWAFLTAEAAGDFAAARRKLEPGDWSAGEEPWIIDFVAPDGHVPAIVRHLRREVFPTQRARSLRRRLDGSIRRLNRWRGAAVKTAAEGERHGSAV